MQKLWDKRPNNRDKPKTRQKRHRPDHHLSSSRCKSYETRDQITEINLRQDKRDTDLIIIEVVPLGSERVLGEGGVVAPRGGTEVANTGVQLKKFSALLQRA